MFFEVRRSVSDILTQLTSFKCSISLAYLPIVRQLYEVLSSPCKPCRRSDPEHAFWPCGEHEEGTLRCHKMAEVRLPPPCFQHAYSWLSTLSRRHSYPSEMAICTICSNRQFASTDALFQHLRTSKKQHYFCDPCKTPFPNESVLNTVSRSFT